MEAEHSSARQGLTRLWNVVCRVLREGNLLDNIFGSCTRCLPVRGDRQLSTVSSESNYSAIPSQTERNLLAAEAAQQGGDISVPPQLHKYFEGEREGSNNDQDPFEEAGQQCNICAGETKFNTHFSVSCRHSACRDCWETWLKEHTTCMVCCEKVQKIQRFSNDLVPSEKDHSNEHIQGDNGCSDDINYRLEQVSNAFMRSLVDVKSRFNDVRERLDEIKAHLNRKNMSFMHGDARLSVTSVEASSLLEQLHVLEAIMQAPPGSRPQTASPVCLLDETARLGDMVKDFNVYLDRCVQEQENQEQLSVDSKQKPQIAMKLLSSCSPPVVLSQWRAILRVLDEIFEETLPQILEDLNLYGHREAGMWMFAQRMEQKSNEFRMDVEEDFQVILPEIEFVIVRIQSCFDYADPSHKDSSARKPDES